MKPRQLRVRNAEAHGRDVAGEWLDTRPVEEGAGLDRVREKPRAQPGEQNARPGVDTADTIPALDPRDLDLVRAHEPRTVDIDQLAIQNILLQQHLLRPP